MYMQTSCIPTFGEVITHIGFSDGQGEMMTGFSPGTTYMPIKILEVVNLFSKS